MLTTDLLPGVPLIESPFFEADVVELPADVQPIARQLHDHGYAILDFPDLDFDRRAEAIRRRLAKRFGWADPAACALSARVQDAWEFDADVRAIACNDAILALLSALYGKTAFPFQTLNFPVGSQQPVHSDHLHFSSSPERFMCGVWVAMEDIAEDSGPLFYYPGSHAWPSFGNENIGLSVGKDGAEAAVIKFIQLYDRLPKERGVARETFLAKKGQALIWASNLLHGGVPRVAPSRARWSQVTHYFFEGRSYWTPLQSDISGARMKRRRVKDVRKRGRLTRALREARMLMEKGATHWKNSRASGQWG